MSGVRQEKDSFGVIEVPADRLWGAQTERSRRLFRISDERMPRAVIHALALVKRAAARVNRDARPARAAAGRRDRARRRRSARRAPRRALPAGRLADRLAARRRNMNVNEVLANRASRAARRRTGRGGASCIRTTTSTSASPRNDVFPTAMHVAAARAAGA